MLYIYIYINSNNKVCRYVKYKFKIKLINIKRMYSMRKI